MSAEDRNGEVSTDEKCTDCTTQERSFDELTRGLASATVSRRGALRLLAGALFGGVLASVPGVGRITGNSGEAQALTESCSNQGQSCTAQKCCAGLNCLIDMTSGTEKFCCSPLSQLVCGSSCCPTGALGNCSAGKCVCPTGEVVCPDANNALAGKCVNLLEDPDNCGGCGTVCPGPAGADAPCQIRACVNGGCTTIPNPAVIPGVTPCEDGNLCTVGDTCNNAGTCQPGTPVDCSALDTQCTEGFCDQQTGTCAARNKADNTACDDSNPCTSNDKCTAGVCAGTPIVGCCRSASDCPTPTNQCQRATCTNNVCGVENKPENTSCDDGNPCTSSDKCTAAGVCAGTPIVGCCRSASDCPTPTNECQRATCTNNVCGVETKPDGSTCNLGCLQGGSCTAGVCTATATSTTTCSATSTNNFCCAANTAQPGQCKRAPTANCTNSSQCCNSCVSGKCT